MAKKPIKIRYKKLGRQKADGLAYKSDRLIYIDPRLSGIDLIETLAHEVYHCQLPDLSEEAVTEYARELAEILWKFNIRQVDNSE